MLEAQLPFEVVHCRVLSPALKLLAALVANVGLAMLAEPVSTVHEPVPTDGILAASVVFGDVMQSDCVGPALETSGSASACMDIVDVLIQPPLISFHSSTCIPGNIFVTELVSSVGVVIVIAVGVSKVHSPEPRVGELPASNVVGELTQMVWLFPAKEVPGTSNTSMLTVEVLEVHTPLEAVQLNTEMPRPRPVTVLVLSVGVVMLTLTEPETTDHIPVPGEIALPANVVLGEVMQRLWLAPAKGGVGASSTCSVTVAASVQAPLSILHSSTVVPGMSPVMVLLGELTAVTEPPPEITDQVPMPTLGAVAARVGVELTQTV